MAFLTHVLIHFFLLLKNIKSKIKSIIGFPKDDDDDDGTEDVYPLF